MCNDNNHNNSGFVTGMILGAIFGAVVAVVIYKNRKEKVFIELQNKLTNFFKNFALQKTKSKKTKTKVHPILKKKQVILPKAILAATTPKSSPPSPKAKLFKK